MRWPARIPAGTVLTGIISHNDWLSRTCYTACNTARWVDWFNHRRLYEYCGDVPPTELETA